MLKWPKKMLEFLISMDFPVTLEELNSESTENGDLYVKRRYLPLLEK